MQAVAVSSCVASPLNRALGSTSGLNTHVSGEAAIGVGQSTDGVVADELAVVRSQPLPEPSPTRGRRWPRSLFVGFVLSTAHALVPCEPSDDVMTPTWTSSTFVGLPVL